MAIKMDREFTKTSIKTNTATCVIVKQFLNRADLIVWEIQHCKIQIGEIDILFKNFILLRSVKCLRSSRPQNIYISFTDSHGFMPNIYRHYSIHYLVYLVECRLKIKCLNHILKAVERMTQTGAV